MNQIKQAEFLKMCHKAGLISSKMLHASLHYPVFIYEPEDKPMTDEDFTEAREYFMDQDFRLINPVYPCFRMVPIGAQYDFWYQVWVTEKDTIYLLVPDDGYRQCALLVGHDGGKAGHWVSGIKDGKVVGKEQLKLLTSDWQDFYKAIVVRPTVTTLKMELELKSKQSVVLKVEPPSKGRSVEWTVARTHYLVLHRRIAHACAEGRRAPTDHELKRGAHWRRAHFRVLRSAKFTKKRGARVPVIQAWVGPKEWIGLDGKTYKVML